MYKNKAADNRCNICGHNIARMRKERGLSQRMLAEKMQTCGVDIDKNAIQRLESGKRCLIDIEIIALTRTFGCSLDELFAPYSISDIPI